MEGDESVGGTDCRSEMDRHESNRKRENRKKEAKKEVMHFGKRKIRW